MQMVSLGRYSKSIVHSELRWYNHQPRLNLYLDVSTNPIVDTHGKALPLTCAYRQGGFKSEKRSISDMGFSDPMFIAIKSGLQFVHPFILNNVLRGEGHTIQRPYLDNLVNFIKLSLGLDLSLVNKDNMLNWDQLVSTALHGKMLTADWAQWWSLNGPFAGPDGTNMAIV